ncbi:MAG: sigma-70 family RNA polymerase sigma factor [Gaiellales bacterium]
MLDDSTAHLASRAAAGDAKARDQLIEQMRPMVAGLARRFTGAATRADLEQAGMVGVLTALEGFDPARGVEFQSYASAFVVGEMARCARESASGVRVPRALREDARVVDDAVEEFSAGHGRPPTVAELADASGLELDRVIEVLHARTVSRPVRMGAVPDEQLASVDPELEEVESRLDLGNRLARLDPRQRRILALRVGSGLSQREIADRVGLSQMHVSRLLRSAFELVAEDD